MRLDVWEGWGNWTRFVELDWKTIPHGPGTYMIAARHRIKRAVGVDDEGILDIGTSKRLKNRLKEFWQCANGKRLAGHMAGWRFANLGMVAHFPLDCLYVCWREASCAMEAAREEGRLLEEYARQHMEMPPLNYNTSRRHRLVQAETAL